MCLPEADNKNYEINFLNTPYEYIGFDGYHAYNIHTVKKWLNNHNRYNREIRQLSNYLYNLNGVYTNVIDYMVSLPTLDRVVYGEDRKNPRYKKNKERFNSALEKIREKSFVRDALFKSALEGVYFYYFDVSVEQPYPRYLSDDDIDSIAEINSNNSDFNCHIIPLPTDYCKIIGTVNSSPQVAFDLSFFDKYMSKGLSKKLRRYPKEIRSAYSAYRKDSNKKWYVLDNDKTIANKVRAKMEDMWGRPVGLAAYIDILYDEYFTESKRSILDDVNTTIIYQTFPEGKDKGTSSLTRNQQKEQHNNIKQALFSRGVQKGINFFSVAAGTKIDKLATSIDLLKVDDDDKLLRRISSSLGFASSLISGEGGSYQSQRGNLDLITAQILVWLEGIESELNKVINKNIIKDSEQYIKVYYLPITHANKEKMIGYFKDLFTHAGGSRSLWIASTGINPDVYFAVRDEEIERGLDEKYKPHELSFTQTSKDKLSDSKKPKDDDPENEHTIKNKNTGSNPI